VGAAPGIGAPPAEAARAARAPVLLATLGVPFEEAAVELAVSSALEAGQPLVVANVVELPPLGMSVNMGYDQLEDAELTDALRRPAVLAASLGIEIERLRVRSVRPVEALLELVAECRPGLLVFGPDRSRLRQRRYRKAAGAIRERAACLVWLAD
jgi:hypothetical protein